MLYDIMYVQTVCGPMTEVNNCICCAERRMLSRLRELSRREGNSPARFSTWTYRKYGELVVTRLRRDGQPGTSLPCILCRKALDKVQIPWRAHINHTWVSSRDEHIPPSKLTQKQKMWLK
jgi:hypothetical protein